MDAIMVRISCSTNSLLSIKELCVALSLTWTRQSSEELKYYAQIVKHSTCGPPIREPALETWSRSKDPPTMSCCSWAIESWKRLRREAMVELYISGFHCQIQQGWH